MYNKFEIIERFNPMDYKYNLSIMPPLLLILIFLISCSRNDKSFELRGKVSPDIDSLIIYPSFIAKEFVDSTFYHLTSHVDEGNFAFKGKMPYPHMMNLSYKGGMSNPFFLEDGIMDVSIDFEDGSEISFMGDLKSPTQREYEMLKISKLDSIYYYFQRSSTDEERKRYWAQIDYELIDHLKVNPNSYVVLWILLDRFCKSGYEYNKNYEEALGKFSNEIKDLVIFKKFRERVAKNKYFSFTERNMPLKDIDGNDVVFNLDIFKDKNYLLIDFWYSECSPCLQEMPSYRPIYEKYKSKGFEIVSISVDRKKKIDNWKNVIEEEGFNWIQYLDLGGLETRKMNINSYPTTFLIDSHGKIIEKDITSQKLEKFLEGLTKDVN